MSYALAGKRVWVAGHNGMVGAGLVRQLESWLRGRQLTFWPKI